MRHRVYISSAISNGGTADSDERLANVAKAAQVAAELIERGFSMLCPALTEYLERITGKRIPHDLWIAQDLPWVSCAHVVLRLPGESQGADMEVEYAQELDIPVVYSLEQLEEWRAREMQVEFGTGCVWGDE